MKFGKTKVAVICNNNEYILRVRERERECPESFSLILPWTFIRKFMNLPKVAKENYWKKGVEQLLEFTEAYVFVCSPARERRSIIEAAGVEIFKR